MWEQVRTRLDGLSRRAGLQGLPPVAVGAIGLVLCCALTAAAWRWWPREAPGDPAQAKSSTTEARAAKLPGSGPGDPSSAISTPAGGKGSSLVTVHVIGAVLHPGVYELPASSRVCDAVTAAGGLAGNAAQEALNLARLLADGEQVAVPTTDDYAKAQAGQRAQIGSGAGASVVSPSGASAGNPGAPPAGSIVNINTADASALDSLPGVGPSTAAKIVADREANGPFASVDDLGRVSGIGPKKLEQLKAYVSVR